MNHKRATNLTSVKSIGLGKHTAPKEKDLLPQRCGHNLSPSSAALP